VSRRRVNRPNVPCALIALVLSVTLWCHVSFIKQDFYNGNSEISNEQPVEPEERELTADATEDLL